MHTAEHILNGTMVRMFGCGRSFSAHIERKKSKCDYRLATPLSESQLRGVEDAVNAVIDRIQSNPTESFQETVNGVEIRCESSFVGYSGDSGTFIIPLEGTDTYLFTMDYTMTLADAG